jgi:hypothetical protein
MRKQSHRALKVIALTMLNSNEPEALHIILIIIVFTLVSLPKSRRNLPLSMKMDELILQL